MCVRGRKLPKPKEARPLAPAPEKTAESLKYVSPRSRRSRKSKLRSSSKGGGQNTSTLSLRIPLKNMGNLKRYG